MRVILSSPTEQKPGILTLVMPDKFTFELPKRHRLSRQATAWVLVATVILGALVILGVVRLAHRGRLLPGSEVYGINVSGMTPVTATDLLKIETVQYINSSTIIVNSGQTQLPISAQSIGLVFDPSRAVNDLYLVGRTGNILQRFSEQIGLMTGLVAPPDPSVSFNPALLYAKLSPSYQTLNKPVRNAKLEVTSSDQLTVMPEVTGQRLNLAQFLGDYALVVARLERGAVTLQTTPHYATLTSSLLAGSETSFTSLIKQPLVLTYDKKTWKVPTNTIAGWLSPEAPQLPARKSLLTAAYGPVSTPPQGVHYNSALVKEYLATITPQVSRPAQDAALTVSGNKATVFKQSIDGQTLDVDATAQAIIANLTSPAPGRDVALTVAITKAAVTTDTIDNLGINDLLSEGVTYFPGSSANRLINVRTGAKQFNGVLLKPGQIFSFGELLGPVGPEQGYREGHVILQGRQEDQYGGGLCQVSSTAFRAALLAGLPIVERVNHSFAVSFYTAPYGVPGIDATIYYPDVDFKFKNDTDHYILIQTEMVGTTLKFRYYGTKKKEGTIRGPNFIYGSNDPNVPSRTVFYRDISVDGKVVKTDTFYTSYKSALDFPSIN